MLLQLMSRSTSALCGFAARIRERAVVMVLKNSELESILINGGNFLCGVDRCLLIEECHHILEQKPLGPNHYK